MASLDWLSKKRIPTIIGLIVLVVGLVGGIFVVQTTNTNTFLPRAAPETTPKGIKVTNVSDTSFTVSWVTDSKTTGYVKYGTSANALNSTFADDRDQTSGTVGLFKTHHVSLKGLKPNTTYYYRLGTGTKELYDDNGKPYSTTTTSSLPPGSRTVYGLVKLASGTPAAGALVYVESPELAPMSGVVQSSGSWVISLAQARSKDLKSSPTLVEASSLSILAVSSTDNTTSSVTVTLSDAQPVADITLGQNALASATLAPNASPTATAEPIEAAQSKFSSQLLAPPTEVIDQSTPLSISYPVQNEVISASKPEFRGKTAPSTKVTLSLAGTVKTNGTTTTQANGVWAWTPPTSLKNGVYTLTASATIDGKAQTATSAFSVDTSKAGTPSLVATPSAATATPAPTASASSIVEYPATTSAQPVTASFGPTLLLALFGFGFLAIGSFFALHAALRPERN